MDRYDGKEVKNWLPYVGKRCIVIRDEWYGSTIEITVLEVSPKGRVKFKFSSGYEGWEDSNEYLLIEELPLAQ